MAQESKKFLVFAKPAIGDILLATPLLRSIRASEPEATIDVMCYSGQEGILEGNPDISNVVVVSQKPTLPGLIGMLLPMFRKYDVAITNAADDRAHLYLLILGKKRVSVTLKGGPAWKRWIVDGSVEDDPVYMHALLRNNYLGNLLGYPARYDIRAPCVHGSRFPAAASFVDASKSAPYAVIHPDARLPYKRWTRTGWIDVIKYLAEQGLTVYITGGQSVSEKAYIDELTEHAPRSVRSVAGMLRLAEVADLLRGCQVYLGVDTAISHMAAAVGAPTIALFGPENPVRWGPWPAGYAEDRSPWSSSGSSQRGNVQIVQASDPCRDCRQGACLRLRSENCRRMAGISSEQVIDGIRQALENNGRSTNRPPMAIESASGR